MGTGFTSDMDNWVIHIFHENVMELKILAVSIVAVGLWQIVTARSSGPKLPPGPLNLPVVGAMFFVEKNICEWYGKMAQKFGKTFYFRLGGQGIVVVCSAEGAEEVLKAKDAIFANRPNNALLKSASKYIGFEAEDIVFASYTDKQKNLKKLLVNNFFTVSQLNRFEDGRRREGAFLAEDIQRQMNSRRIVKVSDSLMDNSINMICSLISGRRYTDSLTSETDELKHCPEIIRGATDLFLKMNLRDFFPWMGWVDILGVEKEFKMYNQLCHKVFGQIIEEHREARRRDENYKDVDIVDTLLTLHGEGKITDNAIRGCILDMLVGGTDSHAATTEWALLELAKNPDCLAKLQKEIDEVVGKDRRVEESDYPNLPYLQAVIHETFRFHAPAPFLVPHFTTEATTLQGFYVPPNTTVFVNVKLITRDALYWKDPETFDPERFMRGEKINLTEGKVFSLVPFGSGRRKCPAATMGHLMVQRNLCTLVHAFDWSPPPGKTKDDIDNKESLGGLARPETPLLLSAKPRLDLGIYRQLIR